MPESDEGGAREPAVTPEATPDSKAEAQPDRPLGADGEEVLALAFGGGGLDTAMQLGVAHALVRCDARVPHVVVGISAGAINAAILAEVMRSSAGIDDFEARYETRARRLRGFIDAYEAAPGVLLGALLPDAYEINAAQTLEPLRSPLLFGKERKAREDAVNARTGLTHLINHALRFSLPVSVVTRVVRRILGLREAAELPFLSSRATARLRHGVFLWWLALINLHRLAPTVGAIALGLSFPRRRMRGVTAGSIVQRGVFKLAIRGFVWLMSFVGTFVLWAVAPLLVLLIWLGRKLRDFYMTRGGRDRVTAWGWLRERILRRFGISRSLGRTHALRMAMIRLLDRDYFGRIDMQETVRRALRRDDVAVPSNGSEPKRLSSYFAGDSDSRIWVAPIAADVRFGKLTPLPQDTAVVDALLAAVAVVPVFPALPGRTGKGGDAEHTYYIDGMNLANEPTSALIDLLREKVHEKAKLVRIFAVSPLPLSKGGMEDPEESDDSGSVAVTRRVLELRKLRESGRERKLTEYYTSLLPGDRAVVTTANGQRFVRAALEPIEPDSPLQTNSKVFTQSKADTKSKADTESKVQAGSSGEGEERGHDHILDAVATGCRRMLEILLADEIDEVANEKKKKKRTDVRCREAIARRLTVEEDELEGQGDDGPGIPDVCGHCSRRLRSGKGGSRPKWPRCVPTGEEDRETVAPAREVVEERRPAAPEEAAPDEPWKSLLLSGGVFRGVFQVGVINALSEVELRPNLVAGASVGSIMGAMAASVLSFDDIGARRQRMALLSSTFLSLDRLILTDRFADAIRGFTLRAGATRFSPRDLDLVFRRYDVDGATGFSRRLRRVIGGLERLLYVSPFELAELLHCARDYEYSKLLDLLHDDVQEFLDRIGVGDELLGTEPLELLIRKLVLEEGADAPNVTFDGFIPAGGKRTKIELLAVATNLRKGHLETFSSASTTDVLCDGLLASSAFPFVFRPRRAWEARKGALASDRLVDGGVIDNLPLDEVTRFLDRRCRDRQDLRRRPSTPHLILAASLQPEVHDLTLAEAQAHAQDWVRLMARARRLSYNTKSKSYARAQENFRRLHDEFGVHRTSDGKTEPPPLNLEVATIVPKWLCGTFAFHPMLGFRHTAQAASIAHGCASTLARLWGLIEHQSDDVRAKAWGLGGLRFDRTTLSHVSVAASVDGSERSRVKLTPKTDREPGRCWFRHDRDCPFSSQVLSKIDGLKDRESITHRRLALIYARCGDWKTHEAGWVR